MIYTARANVEVAVTQRARSFNKLCFIWVLLGGFRMQLPQRHLLAVGTDLCPGKKGIFNAA